MVPALPFTDWSADCDQDGKGFTAEGGLNSEMSCATVSMEEGVRVTCVAGEEASEDGTLSRRRKRYPTLSGGQFNESQYWAISLTVDWNSV